MKDSSTKTIAPTVVRKGIDGTDCTLPPRRDPSGRDLLERSPVAATDRAAAPEPPGPLSSGNARGVSQIECDEDQPQPEAIAALQRVVPSVPDSGHSHLSLSSLLKVASFVLEHARWPNEGEQP